jgi:membrane-associated phospholipid phosphatase
MRRRRRIALVFAALFVALAILVELGEFTWLDQYAVHHWMPWLAPANHPLVSFTSLFLPQTVSSTFGSVVDVWTYPASVFPSGVIVAAVFLARGWSALVWPVLWVAANVVELAGKLVVERPNLYLHGMHVTGFDHSLPSGHTLRSLVIAAALAATWRAGRAALAWAATIPFALVALGDHTPTDVVAGILAFCALYLALRQPGRECTLLN